MNETQTTPELTEKQQLWKSRLIFWIRMLGWCGIGCVAPIVVFAVKFGLFTTTQTLTDSLGNPIISKSYALNGWGILSCFLVGIMIMSILKEVAKAYTGYSLTKQVINGIIKTVIPLVIAYAVCYFLDGMIHNVMTCLAIIIITRVVAIPLNPLPKWRYEKLGKEDYAEASELLTRFVKNLKEKEGSEK